jgi:type II secretory pathway pseudopilin PulG
MRAIKQQGFTLLEVLVASIIMIAVISITALSFQSARRSSETASATLEMLAPLPLISDTIKAQIRANPIEILHGTGQFDGVTYKWQAKTLLFSSAPSSYDAENDVKITFAPRYRLYQVELTLTLANKTEYFQFNAISWLPRNVRSEES